MTGVACGAVACCGLIASLTVAGAPMAAVAGAAFGLAAFLAARSRLRGRWQPRGQGTGLLPLRRRLRAAAARPRWTAGELAALSGGASLSRFLNEAGARREGKFR